MAGSRSHSDFFYSNIALIFWSSIPCVVFLLLKVVSYYDLSVLSMSVMGFQKKVWMGWVGVVSSIQFYFGFLESVLTLQSP